MIFRERRVWVVFSAFLLFDEKNKYHYFNTVFLVNLRTFLYPAGIFAINKKTNDCYENISDADLFRTDFTVSLAGCFGKIFG